MHRRGGKGLGVDRILKFYGQISLFARSLISKQKCRSSCHPSKQANLVMLEQQNVGSLATLMRTCHSVISSIPGYNAHRSNNPFAKASW